jgi:hypothetical protein
VSLDPNRWLVTANFTDDGAVAYRRADGSWSRALNDAGLFSAEAEAESIIADVIAREQRHLCDPYVIGVHADGDAIDALTARERIRAAGPTIQLRRPDTGLRASRS